MISTDTSFFSFSFVGHHPVKDEIWGFSNSYPADKVLKSTDGGAHWVPLTDLKLPIWSVGLPGNLFQITRQHICRRRWRDLDQPGWGWKLAKCAADRLFGKNPLDEL